MIDRWRIGLESNRSARTRKSLPDRDIRRRAKDGLPTVLLTLLSIVQAFALELMWERLAQQDYLYSWSYIAVLGWLQIAASLMVVLLVWLVYSSLVMRFRWVPTTGDSVFPFLVGIVEFALMATLDPEMLGQWFLILALLFGAMTSASQVILRRARLDVENDAFFASRAPMKPRGFYSAAATFAGLTTAGIVLWAGGNQGSFAAVALLFAIGVLAYQLWLNDFYWRRSMTNPTA